MNGQGAVQVEAEQRERGPKQMQMLCLEDERPFLGGSVEAPVHLVLRVSLAEQLADGHLTAGGELFPRRALGRRLGELPELKKMPGDSQPKSQAEETAVAFQFAHSRSLGERR